MPRPAEGRRVAIREGVAGSPLWPFSQAPHLPKGRKLPAPNLGCVAWSPSCACDACHARIPLCSTLLQQTSVAPGQPRASPAIGACPLAKDPSPCSSLCCTPPNCLPAALCPGSLPDPADHSTACSHCTLLALCHNHAHTLFATHLCLLSQPRNIHFVQPLPDHAMPCVGPCAMPHLPFHSLACLSSGAAPAWTSACMCVLYKLHVVK